MSKQKLRPYQEQSVAKIQAAWLKHRRVLFVLHMGAGKTVVAARLASTLAEAGLRVLFVAHRRELVVQAIRKLVLEGVPIQHLGMIMANPPPEAKDLCGRTEAPIQVASIQTFLSRHVEEDARLPFDVIIVDEAQRTASDSYRNMLEMYPKAKTLGLTGTPWRTDGRGLGEDYDELVVGEEISRLIQNGYLDRPRVLSWPLTKLPDLGKLHLVDGDYNGRQLGAVMSDSVLVGNIVEHWMSHARGRRTVAFAADVAHSKSIVSRFKEAGVNAWHLDAHTSPKERDRLLNLLREGRIDVISNCDILSLGWDCPELQCVILARPTLSRALFKQQGCRCMRPFIDENAPPGLARLPPVILDHSGNAIRHGLPDHVRSYDLRLDRPKGPSMDFAKECPSCGEVVESGVQVCPNCSFVFPPVSRSPGERDGLLAEVIRIPDSTVRAELKRLAEFATRFGYKRPWVCSVMRAKYGERGFVMAAAELT